MKSQFPWEKFPYLHSLSTYDSIVIVMVRITMKITMVSCKKNEVITIVNVVGFGITTIIMIWTIDNAKNIL